MFKILFVMLKILFMFLLVLKLCVALLGMLKQVTKNFGNNESVPYLAYSPLFHKRRLSKNSRGAGGSFL